MRTQLITLPVTVFPRTGKLPPLQVRALPASLPDAIAIAVAYADDVCASEGRTDRRSVARAALHTLMHHAPDGARPGMVGSLAVADLRARMAREPDAYSLLDAAL